MLTHLLLFALFLVLPGWLLARLIAPRLAGCLAGFSVSIAVFTANILVFVHCRFSPTAFTAALILQVLALTGWFLAVVDLRLEIRRTAVHLKRERAFHCGAALTVLTAAAYLTYADAYTEVPADVWRHLGYIQWARQALEGERALLPVHPWYYIPAWLWQLSGDDVFTFIREFAAANTLAQGLGIYVFAHAIARRSTPTRTRAAIVAWLAVVFAAFSIGVNVFSYVRYYTFGPMMQNMLVWFCCVLLVLRLFERRRAHLDEVLVLGLLSLTLYALHNQEAAFLYAFILALSVVTLARYVLMRRAASPDGRKADLYIALGVLGVSGLLLAVARGSLPLTGAEKPWIVPLSEFYPAARHLYIANPAYQVYKSLTIWGLLVYVLFFVHWSWFRANLFIVAGMLIPLVTIFNPLFVDMFLRLNEAAPIYRFIYAVPLHIVAACCLSAYIGAMAGRRPLRHKVAAGAGGALLILALLPNGLPVLNNAGSRLPTLAAVPAGNDYHQWRDMIEFVQALESTRVITDPVTAYLLRALTHHKAAGYKFHQAHVPLDRDADYYGRFTGGLIVVNRRDGAPSGNGRRAGHWPVNVLKVSRYYPATLVETLAAEPARFEPIWQRDRIRVYRVLAP